jgi:large subunit ribosomal protein L1
MVEKKEKKEAIKTIDVVKKALETAKGRERKFVESVDISITIKNVDLANPKNRIDEEVQLPFGRGKNIPVALIGGGEFAFRAKGKADLIISPEELDTLAGDRRKAKKVATKYNFFVAETPLMPVVGKKLGYALGPRGKMPKPIPPTADPGAIIENLKRSVRIRSKDRSSFQAAVGVSSMDPQQLADNIDTVLARVEKKLERGKFNIRNVYVKTTMGPAVRLI